VLRAPAAVAKAAVAAPGAAAVALRAIPMLVAEDAAVLVVLLQGAAAFQAATAA
jgi:hypothetical protein